MESCLLRRLLFFVNIYLLFSTCIYGYSFNGSFFLPDISINQTINAENYTNNDRIEYTESELSSIGVELDDYDNRIIITTNKSSVFSLDAKVTVENEQGSFSLPILEAQISNKFNNVYSNDTDAEAFFNYRTFDIFPKDNESSFFIEPIENETNTIINTSKTLIGVKVNYTEFKQHFSMNDNKSCHGNKFYGAFYCEKEAKGRISCFLNSNKTNRHMKRNLEPIHASVTSRKYIPRYSTKHARCFIRIMGDNSYYVLHNYDIDKVISEIHTLFDKINLILSSTDFDGDLQQDDLSLHIQSIVVKGISNVSNDYNNSFDFTKLVDEYRVVPQDNCMSLVFAAMPTEMDLVSTAFTGGICKHNWNKPDLARNLALINMVDSNGCKRSLFDTTWIIAMAIGQVMGSVNRDCDPMLTFPPEEKMDPFFSDCGRQNILNLLMAQGSCLKYPADRNYLPEADSKLKKTKEEVTKSSCGNGRLDPGEECDCGSKEQCKKMQSCCNPPGIKKECYYDRSKGYQCDWTEDCCTRNCEIVPKSWNLFCGSGDASCAPEGSVCNGKSSHCPVPKFSVNLMNGVMCGPATLKQSGAATCQHGQCNSTVCRDAGLEDCMCDASEKQQCRVCCRVPGSGRKDSGQCIPAEYFGLNPKNSKFFYRYPGTVCNEVQFGRCNKDGKCVQLSMTQSLAVPQVLHLHHFTIISVCIFDVIISMLLFY